jgi:hypothetical protein
LLHPINWDWIGSVSDPNDYKVLGVISIQSRDWICYIVGPSHFQFWLRIMIIWFC